MKIVVTGSLGHISRPLVEMLVQQGHEVTVVSSSEERKEAIEQLGAQAAVGSVKDAGFLTSTFSGADVVYCMIPPDFRNPDPINYYTEIGDSYAEAIRSAGVKRVVELSSYGAHLPEGTGFIVGSHRNEKTFDALPGVSVIHIRPGYFYYNLFSQIPMIRHQGKIALNFGGEDRLPMVSPKDIAEAIAAEINQPREGHHVRYVVSDDRSCNEVAAVLGKAIGKPDMEWTVMDDATTKARMEGVGMIPAIAQALTDLGAATHSGALREELDREEETDLFRGRVKLEDFAPEFAAAYNQQQSSTSH